MIVMTIIIKRFLFIAALFFVAFDASANMQGKFCLPEIFISEGNREYNFGGDNDNWCIKKGTVRKTLIIARGMKFSFSSKGKPHGNWVIYYPNKKVNLIVPFKNGQIHGELRHFSELGVQLLSVTYRHGLKHGLFKEWYYSGKKFTRGIYNKDKKHSLELKTRKKNKL